jgi:hypothetical protein
MVSMVILALTRLVTMPFLELTLTIFWLRRILAIVRLWFLCENLSVSDWQGLWWLPNRLHFFKVEFLNSKLLRLRIQRLVCFTVCFLWVFNVKPCFSIFMTAPTFVLIPWGIYFSFRWGEIRLIFFLATRLLPLAMQLRLALIARERASRATCIVF